MCTDSRAYATAVAQRVPAEFVERAMVLVVAGTVAGQGQGVPPTVVLGASFEAGRRYDADEWEDGRDRLREAGGKRREIGAEAQEQPQGPESLREMGDFDGPYCVGEDAATYAASAAKEEAQVEAEEETQEEERAAPAAATAVDPVQLALGVCAPGTRCELRLDFVAGEQPPPWMKRGQAVRPPAERRTCIRSCLQCCVQ